jgi:hypothetical protein
MEMVKTAEPDYSRASTSNLAPIKRLKNHPKAQACAKQVGLKLSIGPLL